MSKNEIKKALTYICIYEEFAGTGTTPARAYEDLKDIVDNAKIDECSFYEGEGIKVEVEIKIVEQKIIKGLY